MRRAGYLIATLTIFTNALAQEAVVPVPTLACPGFEKFLGVGIINEGEGTSLTCADLKPLALVYDGVSKMSPVELTPAVLVAKNAVLDQLEVYNLLTRVFEVGADPTSSAQMKAMPRLFAHEIGHHIFYANAYKNLSEYKDIAEITDLYASAMVEERADSDKVFTSDNFAIFVDMLNIAANYAPEEMIKFDLVGDNYQELFADVVAAVYLEDPEVMKNSIADFGFTTSANRSFSVDLPITAASAHQPYYHFIALRGTLWKEWIKPRMGEKPTVETKKKLIGDLLQIFISEIRQRVAAGEPSFMPLTEEQEIAANQASVASLRSALGLKASL